jgi:hypothetical protein
LEKVLKFKIIAHSITYSKKYIFLFLGENYTKFGAENVSDFFAEMEFCKIDSWCARCTQLNIGSLSEYMAGYLTPYFFLAAPTLNVSSVAGFVLTKTIYFNCPEYCKRKVLNTGLFLD